MIIKAVKKPIAIEAIQLDGTYRGYQEIKEFAKPHQVDVMRMISTDVLVVKTLEGNMIARKNDYVVKGVKGEIYPVNSVIFDETYETLEHCEA